MMWRAGCPQQSGEERCSRDRGELAPQLLSVIAALMVFLVPTTAAACAAIEGTWTEVVDAPSGCPDYQIILTVGRGFRSGTYNLGGKIEFSGQSYTLAGHARDADWSVNVGSVSNGIVYRGSFWASCEVVLTVGIGRCKRMVALKRAGQR